MCSIVDQKVAEAGLATQTSELGSELLGTKQPPHTLRGWGRGALEIITALEEARAPTPLCDVLFKCRGAS